MPSEIDGAYIVDAVRDVLLTNSAMPTAIREHQHYPKINVVRMDNGWSINVSNEQASFQLNTMDLRPNGQEIKPISRRMYLLGIWLHETLRGKGWGRELYADIEEIARRCNCSTVRLYPSGWTHDKLTRHQYMAKLGYTTIDNGEMEKRVVELVIAGNKYQKYTGCTVQVICKAMYSEDVTVELVVYKEEATQVLIAEPLWDFTSYVRMPRDNRIPRFKGIVSVK